MARRLKQAESSPTNLQSIFTSSFQGPEIRHAWFHTRRVSKHKIPTGSERSLELPNAEPSSSKRGDSQELPFDPLQGGRNGKIQKPFVPNRGRAHRHSGMAATDSLSQISDNAILPHYKQQTACKQLLPRRLQVS